jgi:(heptosyl)LPS beta-1,4-glucosyltransferase
MAAGVTGAIIARDGEFHLPACLASLAWTDARLVLLDAATRDRSAQVAREHGARVVTRPFVNFSMQRNAALDLVETPWVLFVDTDERATPALAEEVRAAIANRRADAPTGYWIPRRNYIWGGWIRHGGWWPDYQLRLLRVADARYEETRDVHEFATMRGTTDRLVEPLLHYNYDRLDQFLEKQRHYTRLEARRLQRLGVRARPHNFLLQPAREFRRRYLQLEGHRDGWRGFALASLLAWYTAITYADLARMS